MALVLDSPQADRLREGFLSKRVAILPSQKTLVEVNKSYQRFLDTVRSQISNSLMGARQVSTKVPPIFKIMVLVPQMLSYLDATELAKISSTHTQFHLQKSTALIEQLKTRKHYSRQDLLDAQKALHLYRMVDLFRIVPEMSQAITSLDLCNCDISNEDFRTLLPFVPNLKIMNIAYCAHLNNESIRLIAQFCPKLTELYLKRVMGIDDNCVIALAKGCKDITTINLARCDLITDNSLINLAQNCSKITSIHFYACPNITDAAVLALAINCAGIEYIGLGRCRLITHASIIVLLAKCRQLSEIDLRETALFEDSIITIAMNCPKLKNIFLEEWEWGFLKDTTLQTLVKYGYKGHVEGSHTRIRMELYRKGYAYEPTSPIGKLYKAIINYAAISEIASLLTAIPDVHFVHRIYFHFWALSNKPEGEDWGRIHVLDTDKRWFFRQAVKAVLKERWESLTPSEKNGVYGKIYALRKDRDPTDPQWGENHLDDNSILAVDILSGGTPKPVPLIPHMWTTHKN